MIVKAYQRLINYRYFTQHVHSIDGHILSRFRLNDHVAVVIQSNEKPVSDTDSSKEEEQRACGSVDWGDARTTGFYCGLVVRQ